MKIAIFGQTLYAGVMSALFAEVGNQLYWCDEVQTQYAFDEYLNQMLRRQVKIHYCTLSELPKDIQVCFFAFNGSEQQQTFCILKQLVQDDEFQPKLMVNGCTFGLHTTQQLRQIAPHYEWVYLPDIIQEGYAVQSFLQLKQIIVGVETVQSEQLIRELLRPFFPLEQQFLVMPILDAEFTKLSISGMLATRISYMNDLAQVAEKLGIDILNVRQGLASDGRIGSVYLSPGVGFGGKNFSQDILTLANTVLDTGANSRLLEQVWQINEAQKEILFRKLWVYYKGHLQDKIITIWGASFKENTSHVDYSPTLTMIDALLAQGAIVKLHDPQALPEIKARYPQQEHLYLYEDAYNAVEKADALCVMTAWKQYLSLDYKQLIQKMRQPFLLDGRNIYNPTFVRSQGLIYTGIGRI